MKKSILGLIVASALVCVPSFADDQKPTDPNAGGTGKGAVVGGVGGAMVGHPVAGAVAGGVIGHHRRHKAMKKAAKEQADQQNNAGANNAPAGNDATH